MMMTISRRTIHALEAFIAIAEGDFSRPLNMRSFIEGKGLSERYLEKVMQRLVREGVLLGVRGPGGGYLLARPASEITVGQIVRIAESLARGTKRAFQIDSPVIGRLMLTLMDQERAGIISVLDKISLAQLADGTLPPEVRKTSRIRPGSHHTEL